MTTLTIKRPDSATGPGAISLEEWQAYIASSGIVQPAPSRQGINPFTKERTTFHPSPGAAFFITSSSHSSIKYRSGSLIVNAGTKAALEVASQIAAELGAMLVSSED